MNWPARIAEVVARQGAVVRVTVIRAEGSTPREVGAAMLVGLDAIEDSIGGGALEHQAIAHARMLVATADGTPWYRECRDFALGPSLGQCCGGAVRLLFERFAQAERVALADFHRTVDVSRIVVLRPLVTGIPPQTALRSSAKANWPASLSRFIRNWPENGYAPAATLLPGRKGEPDWFIEPIMPRAFPLVLYGAGHVGRALVRALDGLPFHLTWVDARPGMFPEGAARHCVLRDQEMDPAALMKTLPQDTIHLVMTHSHPLDLAICHAVLKQDDFRFLGLIGSKTKRARFLKRLRALGLAEAQLSRLVCPIGLPGIESKQPVVIAASVAAQLLLIASTAEDAAAAPHP
jgi:xanthine dehydrogenase accessory factor